MLRELLLSLIFLLSIIPFSHAQELDRYCSLMVSIYGACSPELIKNYLEKTAILQAPRIKPVMAPVMKVEQNKPLFNQTPAKMEEKIKVKECWYYTNYIEGWKRCRMLW